MRTVLVAPAVFVVGLLQQVVIAQLHVLVVAMFMKTQLNQEVCHQSQGIQCAHQMNPRVFLIQIIVVILFSFLVFLIVLCSIVIIVIVTEICPMHDTEQFKVPCFTSGCTKAQNNNLTYNCCQQKTY